MKVEADERKEEEPAGQPVSGKKKKFVWLILPVLIVCGILSYVKFKPGESVESVDIDSLAAALENNKDTISVSAATEPASESELVDERILAINLKLDSLAKKEGELKANELELAKREAEVNRLYKKVDSILVSSNTKFVKAFESMDPTKVSSIMEKLSDDEVIKLLLGMGNRSMAQILELMPPERVSRIVSKISELEREALAIGITKETEE